MEITKDLFEKAVITVWNRKPSKQIVVGTTVYAWLLKQGGNPVPMHQYEQDGKSPYMMKITDITSDAHCELLPLIRNFHFGYAKFDQNLLGLKHNFKDQLDFQAACSELGLVGFAVVKGENDHEWQAAEVGNPKPIAIFNRKNGKFSFKIPNTGITAERLRYMVICSKLMSKAYFKDAA